MILFDKLDNITTAAKVYPISCISIFSCFHFLSFSLSLFPYSHVAIFTCHSLYHSPPTPLLFFFWTVSKIKYTFVAITRSESGHNPSVHTFSIFLPDQEQPDHSDLSNHLDSQIDTHITHITSIEHIN
jgi:hypothetical protein